MKSIAIAGLGLIGGSLAKALKHFAPETEIAAYDYPEILSKAKLKNIIDFEATRLIDLLNYDIIILALPIELSLLAFKEIYPKLNKNQIIADMCSVKAVFADAEKAISSKGKYIGLHPMAGKEHGGLENSDHLLFENAVCLASCVDPDLILDEFIDFLKPTGMRFYMIDAYLHDKIVANVSHLPQLLSVALVKSATKKEGAVNFSYFAGGGFRDMTRIASSDFSIWKEIINHNKSNILISLHEYQSVIDDIIDRINNNDFQFLENIFNSARDKRNEIPINNKGFIDPLFDLMVFLKDEPGTLNNLTSILSENNLNIKDIELLKIREGSGGNFRIFFNSQNECLRAKEILSSNGFNVY